MSQYVGRHHDGTLELIPLKELRGIYNALNGLPRPSRTMTSTYSAIYKLTYDVSYDKAIDCALDFETPPPTRPNGDPVGPCFVFTVPAGMTSAVHEIYGEQIDSERGLPVWQSSLPYEVLDDVRVTVSLAYPTPMGTREPEIVDYLAISALDIPLAPDHKTFHPHWFARHTPNPEDGPFYRPDLFGQPAFKVRDLNISLHPVTTPELAHALTDEQWRKLLGPARYYISTHSFPDFLIEKALIPRQPGANETHHPDTCIDCSHAISCGYCGTLLAAPQEWTDRNRYISYACTPDVLRRMLLIPHHQVRGYSSSKCRLCKRFIGYISKNTHTAEDLSQDQFPFTFRPCVSGIWFPDTPGAAI